MVKLLIPMGVLAVVLTACGSGQSRLPDRLAGMSRVDGATGSQADRFVASMRLKMVGAPRASELAHYSGERGGATVYVATYSDEAEARAALESVLADVRSGGTPFRTPQAAANPPDAYELSGLDQHCRIWRTGDTLVWVHGEPKVVEAASLELPRVTAQAIPAG